MYTGKLYIVTVTNIIVIMAMAINKCVIIKVLAITIKHPRECLDGVSVPLCAGGYGGSVSAHAL